MTRDVGTSLKELALQHRDMQEKLASFDAFLKIYINAMQDAALLGNNGLYINIHVDSDNCTACEHDVADMDKGELASVARQYDLIVENYECVNNMNYQTRNHTAFDLLWM